MPLKKNWTEVKKKLNDHLYYLRHNHMGSTIKLASLGMSSSKASSSMTPGNMRELVVSAKQQKLNEHKETQDFECPGETVDKRRPDGWNEA